MTLLVLAPMAIEEAALRTKSRVLRTGMGPERARIAAARALAIDAGSVAIAGLCGGVDPALRPGDVVCASELRREDGTTVAVSGAEELAACVLARSYPWVETHPNEGAWRTLLWALGRISLADRPRLEADGLPGVREPLDRWDGNPPAPRRSDIVEWIPEREGVWRPVYRA